MTQAAPRNAWYVAAWAQEVGDQLFTRRLLGTPMLIYRGADGNALAFEDRCPHRFAPLSMGHRTATGVACPYHGLHFNESGLCDLNPSGSGHFPAGTRLKAFPLIERHRLLWIWPGDPTLANPASIPDFSLIAAPGDGAANIDNYLHVKAGWLLELDNLMDLSHVNFVHDGTLGNESRRAAEVKVSDVGDAIRADMAMPGTIGGFGPRTGQRCDQWLNMIWMPPTSMILEFGAVDEGAAPLQDPRARAFHTVTPETDATTHYFFGSGGAYGPDEAAAVERFRAAQLYAFTHEDNPMIEAVAERMDGADFWSLRPAILPNDKAAIRVRRRLERMVRQETERPAAG